MVFDEVDDFSEYVAARWPRLVRSAILLGCRQAEAEDLVQATLERCLIKWRDVERAGDRDAYVHRVLLNTHISTRRRHWWREQPTAETPDRPGPDEATAIDDSDVVRRALDRLTPDQRAVVVLRYYVHLTETQMATALDVAPGTVKSRLSRALRHLAEESDLEQLRGQR